MNKRTEPEHLTDISIDVQEYVGDKEMKLWEDNNFNWDVYFDLDAAQDEIAAIDPFRLTEYWMKRFTGGCYWSGMLSAYPWENAIYNPAYKLHGDESYIYKTVLEYHAHFDEDNRTLTFRYNPKSPMNGWFRTWGTWDRSGGNVVTDVQTILITALKYLRDEVETVWTWVEREPDEYDEDEELENEQAL